MNSDNCVNESWWGDVLTFEVPDPGFNCTAKLLIKGDRCQPTPILELSLVRSSPGSLTFSVDNGDSKKYLPPGIWFWQVITESSTDPVVYAQGPEGSFEIKQGVASSEIPPST